MRRSLLCFLTVFLGLLPLGAQSAPGGTLVQTSGPAIHSAEFTQITRAITTAELKTSIDTLAAFGTRNTVSEGMVSKTRGVAAARAWIQAQFEADARQSGGRMEVKLDPFQQPASRRIPHVMTLTNVVAILHGTDPNDHRVFIVGGHYDSIPSFPKDILNPAIGAPGANDDGSGTSVVLACAKALSPHRFPATIIFIAFEAEEQGLFGSAHYAAEAKKQGMDVVAMLDNDIVGGDNTPGRVNRDRVRVFSQGISPALTPRQLQVLAAVGGENDSPSRELARYAHEIAAQSLTGFQAVLEFRQDRYLRGGDQMSFNHEGYTAVRFTDFYENYHHQHQTVRVQNGIQYGDLPRFTSPAFTAQVARINALTLATMASSPAAPQHVYYAPKLEPGTTLTWDPVPGAVAYRVLLRPTAAPTWTRRLQVRGTSIHLPQSKDNYMMGVVAVNKQGIESLPATPTLPNLPTF